MFQSLFAEHPFFSIFFISLFFLSLGSLLNVIIYRLPIMLNAHWKEQCCEHLNVNQTIPIEKINLFFPRSFCPQCKNTISALQNIPLFSYFIQLGRCRNCQKKIPKRYPLVEFLTLLLSLICVWQFGFTIKLIFSLCFVWLTICLIFIDLEHQLLPDSLTLGLLWIGLIANTEQLFINLPTAVLSAVGAYLALWIFIKLFYLITGKVGMGEGDFKLFAAFGAWFGWQYLPFILLLSSISGTILGVSYLYIKKKPNSTPIPFGPFLGISGIITLFWGKEILTWYLS